MYFMIAKGKIFKGEGVQHEIYDRAYISFYRKQSFKRRRSKLKSYLICIILDLIFYQYPVEHR
jgi:hypothetical protein